MTTIAIALVVSEKKTNNMKNPKKEIKEQKINAEIQSVHLILVC